MYISKVVVIRIDIYLLCDILVRVPLTWLKFVNFTPRRLFGKRSSRFGNGLILGFSFWWQKLRTFLLRFAYECRWLSTWWLRRRVSGISPLAHRGASSLCRVGLWIVHILNSSFEPSDFLVLLLRHYYILVLVGLDLHLGYL